MASVKRCDRCGAIYSQKNPESVVLKEFRNSNSNSALLYIYDLCEKCKDEFHLKFMTQMKEKNNNGD